MTIRIKGQLDESDSNLINFAQRSHYDDRSDEEKEAQAGKIKAETRALHWETTKDQIFFKLKHLFIGFVLGLLCSAALYWAVLR